MFTKFTFLKNKIHKFRILFALIVLTFVTGAHSEPIIENEVEDLDIIISQFVGGQPNVLTILDLSGSMGRNFGGTEIGNWDNSDAFFRCQDSCSNSNCSGNGAAFDNERTLASHCAENMAGTAVCGTINCGQDGRCDDQSEFDAQVACVQTNAPNLNMSTIFNQICGGPNASDCNTNTERINASAAIEAAGDLTQCMGPSNCADNNPACDTVDDYNRFKNCMQNFQSITANKQSACDGGTPDCKGKPALGSSRLDIALDVFFSFLDSDNSLDSKFCDDPGSLFDGVNTSISCQDYMETPFRDVTVQVRGTGSGFRLPITNGSDVPLIDELTDEDADILGIRFRPMAYSGDGKWAGCTAGNTFQLPQGGFAGASKADLENVWKFYRTQRANGGTPLAYVLGFDDNHASNSLIPNDVLGGYRVELQTDPSIACRPEFVIVITDGEDTCTGECSVTSGSCSGDTTTNANRRSSIQAVSNARTYFTRNPVQNRGQQFKKEILTFVIGLGVNEPEGRRMLNSMALAGGTHTTGVIQHTDPVGQVVGTVDIDTVLPGGSSFDGFKTLGLAQGIDSNPADATMTTCLTPVEDAGNTAPNTGTHCHLGPSEQFSLFYNAFFNTGDPFITPQELAQLDKFAFFANNAEELAAALETILGFVDTFSTTGVSPAAPQSSTSVALRDRIFLSILTPITTERLWQGRLALFGFIDDPDNPGAKKVVDTNRQDIFDPQSGTLSENAKNYHWEAAKKLAERDLATDSRNLLTVDPNTRELDTTGAEIRYTAGQTIFDNSLTPDFFGISDADVFDPIPDFCTADPPDGIDDCSADCVVVTDSACRTCVKECIKDKIVEFMSGDTKILPVGDPLGPIGTNCPDPGDPTSGSLATCSVRLGDIFHSTPLVVGSPSPLFFDVGFQNFASNYRDRTAVVYVGSNDGFLHAFNAGGKLVLASSTNPETNPFTNEDVTIPFFNEGDGRELFGFAPPSFLPDSLSANDPETPSGFTPDFRFGDFKTFVTKELQVERSFFDGSPLVADVFIDGEDNGIPEDPSLCSGIVDTPDGEIDLCGREWHSILLSAYRNGGGAYVALDVTNAKCDTSTNGQDDCNTSRKHLNTGSDYPTHLWTLFDKNFGNTWSDPTVGRVRMQTVKDGNQTLVDRWVMFVGGGLHPTDINPADGVTNDLGNAFYVIDIATGKIIFKYAKNSTTGPNATLTDSRMVCDLPSEVGAFDLNADGFIDLVYEGDTCGRLWRFDVSMPIIDNGNDITETGIGGSVIFTAPDWTGDIAFCATSDLNKCLDPSTIQTEERQPIFFAPTTVLDDLGQRHVIFLTGNRRDPSNVDQFGKLYNFIDGFIPAFLAGGTAVTVAMKTEGNFTSGQIIDLVPQSGVSNQFTTQGGGTINNQGEFIVRFPDNVGTPNGEKGFGSPAVINRVLVFTTFAPNTGESTDPCVQNGSGRVFALDYLSGEPALARIPGAVNIVQGSSAQKQEAAGLTVAEGMPTPAQLTFGAHGSVVLTVAFSGSSTVGGAQFLVMELPPFPTRTQTLFWEEIL